MQPLCVDLYCGLGGWTEGFLAEGYRVVGFDNHRHQYGEARYPGQLVIQDVLTLHGSQFRNAAVIVSSPPCQNYSYLAMPWSRSTDIVRPCGDGWEVLNSAAAKEMREEWERDGPDNRLFDACFRIQREAIEARMSLCRICVIKQHDSAQCCPNCFIPLIVENVRGAVPWVGRSAWNFGSFHLWGDVPALMPISIKRGQKVPGFRFDGTDRPSGSWFRIADSSQGDRGPAGQKVPVYSDPRRNGGKGVHLTSPHENAEALTLTERTEGTGLKRPGIHISQGFNNWPKDEAGAYVMPDGTKIGGDRFSDPQSTCRKHGSRSQARKAASAQIAKIPLPLSQHIAQVYKPRQEGKKGERSLPVAVEPESAGALLTSI